MARTHNSKTWVALWTVYILWGSTYFAIAIAVRSMPSLMSLGFRFTCAAAILGTAILIRKGIGEFLIPRKEILNASGFGALRLAVGIGAVSLGEHTVPTGVAALIFCALPLWVSLFRTLTGDRPSRLTMTGVAIGFAGVAILLKPGQIIAVTGSNHAKLYLWVAAIIFGNFCWSLGTFLAPRFSMPKNSAVSTVYEMVSGGLLLIFVGLISGENIASFSRSTASSWFALVYLTIFGSIIGYSAYVWLVANAPVGLTSTYAYVNPVIAVFLGALFLHERFRVSELIGAVVVVLGVILVVTAEGRSNRAKLEKSLENL